MGRVFFDIRENTHSLTADYQALASDSGKVFFLDAAAAARTITMPTMGTVAQEGWNCTFIVDDAGTGVDQGIDYKVNIDMGDGVNIANVGWSFEIDNGTHDFCVANDDFINITTNASPGDKLYFWTDGDRWYVEGFVKDVTAVAFGTATA
jgi:hypothetical protein